MKKFYFKSVLFVLALTIGQITLSQTTKSPAQPLPVVNTENNFYSIRNSFNNYLAPLKVDRNGNYIDENGEEIRVPGYKQFKRWEWYWETRVDKATGDFPATRASDIFMSRAANGSTSRSATGNWTSLGPSSSSGGYHGLGRLNCIGFRPGDNNTYYAGSPSGGLWKTTDDGTTWSALTDDNAVLGVSEVVVLAGASPATDTLYLATGDRDGGSLWSMGGGQTNDNNSIGILKSVDGGTTWNSTGLTYQASEGKMVYRLKVNPDNHNVLFAATSDGLYKTTDGGTTWTLLTSTVFYDMEFKPGNAQTMYGGGYSDGKVYLSTDGGSNWTESLNSGGYRVVLGVSPNESTWVYAAVVTSGGSLKGFYKSETSGTSYSEPGDWINLMGANCDGSGRSQGTYDLALDVDPTNANVVFVGGVNTWKTSDGGVNWYLNNYWTGSCGGSVPEVHADKHRLAFQNNTATLFECNDGGVYKTSNGGTNWNYVGSGIITGQLYRMGVSQTVSGDIIAGLQDNGTKSVNGGTWEDVIGGDGMDCDIDYTNNNIQYGEYQNGALQKTTNHWVTSTDIGFQDGQWVTPFAIDPSVHTTIYSAPNHLLKSTNQGANWAHVSNESVTEFAIAPSNSNYIYAVNENAVLKTTDGAATWIDITGSLPVNYATPTYVAVKYNDPNTAWVTFGQYNTYSVYETTDGGSNWTDISYGLPVAPVMSIVQNRQNSSVNELYVGTDVGVYVKYGTGQWELFSTGLPNVVVTELKIYYDDATPANSRLRAATYGRGVWESDLYTYTTADPVADFVADDTVPILNQTVLLSDFSTHQPTSWQWSITPSTYQFVGGTSATSQYPKVQFSVLDDYTVQLTVTNALGSDSKTRTNYITVGTYHNYCSASGGGTGYISGVELGNISNTNTTYDSYHDYKALTDTLYRGQLEIPVTITNGITNGNYDVAAWIDFDRDGIFDETSESIVCEVNNGATGTYYFDVPADADTGITVMRVRIKYSGSTCGSPCGTTGYGEVEDYSIQMNETPSCPPPAYQTESNITGTAADLSWSQAGTVSSWDVRIVTSGTDTSGTGYATTSANPLTVDTLTGNTTYDWYVRASCGSAWIGPATFQTACTSLTAPHSENFDGVSTPDLPGCWTKIVYSTSSYAYVNTSTDYENSAPNSVDFYNSNDLYSTLLLVSPQFTDLTTQQNMISFYAAGYDGGEDLIVGTMSDPADTATFSKYTTINLTDSYDQYQVFFGADFTDNNTYIAFKHGNNGGYQDIYLDDFEYTVIPGCPKPSQLTEDSITNNSAKLSWTENGNATSWNIRIVTAGTDTTGLPYSTISSRPLTVDTLTGNTTYDWYVRSGCGSDWSLKATFTTLCSSTTATLTENFDTPTAPALPDCWSSIVYSSDSYAGVRTYNSSYNAHSSPNSVMLDNNTDDAATLLLISPELSDLTSQLNQIRFYAKANYDNTNLIVGTMSDPADTATFTEFKTIALTTGYVEYTVMFGSTFTQNDNYIAFKSGVGGSYHYIYIDDFVYEPMPACPPLTDLTESNITTTSATLSWTENGSATSWDFRIMEKDADTTGTSYVTKTSNMIIVDTLTRDTYYDWYVRSDCGNDWQKSTFVTDCGTYTVHYTEDFDRETAPDISHCWSSIINSSSTYAVIESTTSYSPNTSPNHVMMYNYNDNDALLLFISPDFTDLSTQLNQITFYAKATDGGDSLIIGTMSDPADENTFTRFKKINLTTTYTQYTVMFGTSYILSDEYIAFKSGVGATYKRIWLDDFDYDYMPVNPPPSDQYETNITQTGAQLGWTENGTATSWDVRIVPENADTTGVAYATTSNNPMSVDTLQSNTYYDWYVREEGSENWAGPSTFVTDCGSFTATYSEDFDDVTAPAIPHCFSTIVNSTAANDVVETYTNYEHSSPNHVRMYKTGDANATLMLITPQFSDLTTQQNQIRFYAYGNSGTSLIIGTMSDPASEATFTGWDTIALTISYAEYTYYFGAGYTGTDEYIAFKHYSGGTYKTVYIDDFVYEPMPACPHPTNQSVGNIGVHEATLQWLENGSSTSWDVRIVPEGTDTTGLSYATLTSNPVTIDTLTSATYYDWYVRSSCGSDWIGPNTFVTDCDTYSATFSENFDGVTVPELPICWSSINDAPYPNQTWVKTVNNHGPNSAPNHVEMYNYYYYNNTDLFLVSPQLSDLTSQHNQIRFYAKGYNSNYTLIVGTMSDPADKSTFTARKTIVLPNTYAEYKVYFGGTYTLSDEYIAFKHGSTDRYQMIELDDIHYEPITDCLTPLNQSSQNINSSTEKLSWIEQGNATSWDVRIVPYGTDTTGVSWQTVSSNPLTVDTLSAGTQYSWYVRAACGSDWTGPDNFTTECAAITSFPFAEGFENGVPPVCWHNTMVTTGNVPPNWSQTANSYYPSASAAKGNYMAMFNSHTASAGVESRLSTPQLDFTGLSNAGLTFWFYHYTTSSAEGIQVQASVNGGTWTNVGSIIQRTGTSGWVKYTVNLKDYVGMSNVSIGFLANGNHELNLYLDSIMIVSSVPATATWSGTMDDSWYEDANWSTNIIPFDSTDVVIPPAVANYPKIVSDAAVCKSITIQSDASGDGALIGAEYLTVSNSATVERYIPAWTDYLHGWHEISSPVASQNISPVFVDISAAPISNLVDFYRWSETDNIWVNIKNASGNYNQGLASTNFSNDANPVFEPGKGYLIAYGSNQTKLFTGTLNSGDVNINSLSFSVTSGWHLLGNPYPSALYWNKTGWGLTNIDGTAKIWKDASASYIDVPANTGIIPAMQGFMVHVNAAFGSLTIDADDRTNGLTSWYKDIPANTFKLTAVDLEGNTAQECIIRFDDDATREFDKEYDSHFLPGYAPQFYAVEKNLHLSTDAILPLSSDQSVLLNFIKNSAAHFIIKAEGIENMDFHRNIYLKDLKTNYTQLLNDNPVYEFMADENDNPQRFEIVLSLEENEISQSMNIFSANGCIEIRAEKNRDAVVTVYNITGQMLVKRNMKNQKSVSINMNGFTGLAVVTVVGEKSITTQKVILQ